MTKANIDYQNGKIYKIVDNTNGNIYVGSTTKKYLSQRLTAHVKAYKRHLNGKHNYMTSFKILENKNYDILLIELCPCNSVEELRTRERYHIETIKCVNKNIAGRSSKEWREDNKEKIKIYKEDNKEQIQKNQKEYQNNNRIKISAQRREYRENHKLEEKALKQKYYEANKEHLKLKAKKYADTNNEKVKEYQKQYASKRFYCECGSVCSLAKKSPHLKTMKHINFVKLKEQQEQK
jgi:hypothetical protein